jgi:hypothetical protein
VLLCCTPDLISFRILLLFATHRDRQNMGNRYLEVFQGKRAEYYAAIASVSSYDDLFTLSTMYFMLLTPPMTLYLESFSKAITGKELAFETCHLKSMHP